MSQPLVRWLSLRGYGLVTSALFRATTPPEIMRRRFERWGATSRATMRRRHPSLVFGDHSVGPLAIESVCAVERPTCAVLYLHGGAFVMGSPSCYRSRTARLSHRCDAEVFVPDYRLAPEHPFPAALDDALAAWQFLESHRPETALFVAGDSAGGGLALSLSIWLRDLGRPLPAGAVLMSPWTDLSRAPNGAPRRDLWLSRQHLERWARYYVGGADATAPLVSPALADLSRLPPLLVLAGEDELLADGAARLVERAREAGTEATLLLGEGMQHDWLLTLPWLDESRRAWTVVADFVERKRKSSRPRD